MISAGVDGRHPYMTYPEPWRGPPKQPSSEFLRPAPKPLTTSRYNGVATTSPNGTRVAQPQRPVTKYPTQTIIATPVNLTQHKDEVHDDLTYSTYTRLYTTTPHFPHFPPYPIYQPYPTHMLRPSTFPPTSPLSPQDPYTPTTPTGTNSSTFLSPAYSPPASMKPSPTARDKRTPPQLPLTPPSQAAFKVPSGKEGSLKHRILRPEDAIRSGNIGPLDLQKPPDVVPRKRLAPCTSPPRSPRKSVNNNVVSCSFTAGSLIQLATGELRRIEDMRTEDFVLSAEKSPELRLADSTVVKIEDSKPGNSTITLSYNQRRTQIDVESTSEHPYFVYGQGWASCCPDRTQQYYGLKVHKLQVGDILISLTPREPNSPMTRTSTIMTTATTTAMSVRQTSISSTMGNDQSQPLNLHTAGHSSAAAAAESLAARKRRWSAPEICEEDEQNSRRHRGE